MSRPRFVVYFLRCRDGSLYAGYTTDPARRLAAHRAGTASAYTRSRGVIGFVRLERHRTRSAALRREAALKRLTKADKESLVRSTPTIRT